MGASPDFTLVALEPAAGAHSMSISLHPEYLNHAFPSNLRDRYLAVASRLDSLMGTLLTRLYAGEISALEVNFRK